MNEILKDVKAYLRRGEKERQVVKLTNALIANIRNISIPGVQGPCEQVEFSYDKVEKRWISEDDESVVLALSPKPVPAHFTYRFDSDTQTSRSRGRFPHSPPINPLVASTTSGMRSLSASSSVHTLPTS